MTKGAAILGALLLLGSRPLPPRRRGRSGGETEPSQRQRLLRALIDTVAEDGYLATTVGSITARAHVSRSAFYEHFADRRDCYDAACDALLEDLVDAVAAAYARPGPWPQRVRAGLDALVRRLAADPSGARVLVGEVSGAIVHAEERYRTLVATFDAMGADGLEYLGQWREEMPRRLGQTALGGVSALLFDEINAGHVSELEQRMPDLLYTLLVPYLGHAAAYAEAHRADDADV